MISDFQIYDYALAMGQVADLHNNADFDGDGDVDGADFLLIQRADPSRIEAWKSQFGQGGNLGATTAAVPEPATLALVSVSALAVAVIGRRHQRRRR
jgi:hypothetical protein